MIPFRGNSNNISYIVVIDRCKYIFSSHKALGVVLPLSSHANSPPITLSGISFDPVLGTSTLITGVISSHKKMKRHI